MTEAPHAYPAFLVVWVTDDDTDRWVTVDDFETAQTYYANLCEKEHVRTVSICVCLRSTDYPTITSYQL